MACAAPMAQAAAPWGGAGHNRIPVPGGSSHLMQQAPQLTPAQERKRRELEELDAALKVRNLEPHNMLRLVFCCTCIHM